MKAFRHTAKYDSIVSAYLGQAESFPGSLHCPMTKWKNYVMEKTPISKRPFTGE